MDFRVKAGGQIGLRCEASESEAVKIAVNNLKQDLKQAADIRAAESGEGIIFVERWVSPHGQNPFAAWEICVMNREICERKPIC